MPCGVWMRRGDAPGGGCGELEDRIVVHRQVAADGELGDAVDEGPGGEGVGHGVAGRKLSGLLDRDDAVEEDAKGFLTDVGWGAAGRERWRRWGGSLVEHDGEVIGPVKGELDVAAAGEDEALGWGLGALLTGAHGLDEAFEAFGGYGSQQLVFAGEVTVGGVVGDAGAAGDFAQGEGARTDFSDENDCRVEQGLAEIGVVIRLIGCVDGHGRFLTDQC